MICNNKRIDWWSTRFLNNFSSRFAMIDNITMIIFWIWWMKTKTKKSNYFSRVAFCKAAWISAYETASLPSIACNSINNNKTNVNFELFPIYFFFFKKKKTKYQQQHHHQLAMLKQSHLQEVPDLFSLVFLTIHFYKKIKNNIEANQLLSNTSANQYKTIHVHEFHES